MTTGALAARAQWKRCEKEGRGSASPFPLGGLGLQRQAGAGRCSRARSERGRAATRSPSQLRANGQARHGSKHALPEVRAKQLSCPRTKPPTKVMLTVCQLHEMHPLSRPARIRPFPPAPASRRTRWLQQATESHALPPRYALSRASMVYEPAVLLPVPTRERLCLCHALPPWDGRLHHLEGLST